MAGYILILPEHTRNMLRTKTKSRGGGGLHGWLGQVLMC